MEVHEVEVLIEKDGKVKIEVRGIRDERCSNLTARLLKALGNEPETKEAGYGVYTQEAGSFQ